MMNRSWPGEEIGKRGCQRLSTAGLLRVRQRQCWRSSLECAKELECGSGDSPEPSRVVEGL